METRRAPSSAWVEVVRKSISLSQVLKNKIAKCIRKDDHTGRGIRKDKSTRLREITTFRDLLVV